MKSTPTAADVMTRDPICVAPSTRVRELARIFEENEISGAPVVDQRGALIGVVSKSDLIRRCSEASGQLPPAYLFEVLADPGADPSRAGEVIPEPLVCVEDFMTATPVSVAPDEPASQIAKVMHKRKIHRVIVVDASNYPIGVITSLDLLGVFPR